MLQYNVNKYTNGINGYSLLFGDTNYSALLTAGVETTVVVPNLTSVGMYGQEKNKLLAQFTFQGLLSFPVVWVNLNATAAVPAGDLLTFCGGNVLSPNARMVQGGDVIHMITSQNNVEVGIEFFSLQQ